MGITVELTLGEINGGGIVKTLCLGEDVVKIFNPFLVSLGMDNPKLMNLVKYWLE